MTKLNIEVGVYGEFDLYARKADGSMRKLHSQRNLITDTGMNQFFNPAIAINTFGPVCRVGTGITAPAFTNTALVSQIAAATRSGNATLSWVGDTTYAVLWTSRHDFAVGAAAGNLTELGLGGTTSDNLLTRALFVDGGGTPITVTVLSDESLIVFYRMVFVPNTGDTTFTVSTGSPAVSYTLTMRPADLNNTSPNSGNGGPLISSNWRVYTGATSGISAITATPSGTQSSALSPTITNGTYTPGTFTRTDKVTIGATLFTGTSIGAFMSQGTLFDWQIGVSPRFNKTNTQIVTIDATWSMARL